MISAMYENGGNTTHRMLNGHPQLFVYPFESQLGTRKVNDFLESAFPQKYRWPSFDFTGSPGDDYQTIIMESGTNPIPNCRNRLSHIFSEIHFF